MAGVAAAVAAGPCGAAGVRAGAAEAAGRIRAAGKRVREDFMHYAWINDVLVAGARQILGSPPK